MESRTNNEQAPAVYAIALLFGALGAAATMLLHPTGQDLLGQSGETARAGEAMSVATHAAAIASGPLIFFGFLGLGRLVGVTRPAAHLALTGWGVAVVTAICAAVINGFAAPQLTRRILQSAGDPSLEPILRAILWGNLLLNQAFSKVYAVAASAAIIAWCFAVFRLSVAWKVASLFGLLVGAAGVVGISTGRLKLDVHGFGLLVFAQLSWVVAVAAMMLFGGKRFVRRRPDVPQDQ